MKANKNNVKAQYGRLGVISLIALTLCANQAMAGFDLWVKTGDKADTKLSHLTTTPLDGAKKWLLDPTQANVELLVKEHSKNPVAMMEAFAAAWKEEVAKGEESKWDEKKESILTHMADKETLDAFGDSESLQKAYVALFTTMAEGDVKDETFMEDTFNAFEKAKKHELLALNVTDTAPKKKDDPKKDEPVVGEKEKADKLAKPICDAFAAQKDAVAKLTAEMAAAAEKARLEREADKKALEERIAAKEKEAKEAKDAVTDLSARASQLATAQQIDPAALAQLQRQNDAGNLVKDLLANALQPEQQREQALIQPNDNGFNPFQNQQTPTDSGDTAPFQAQVPEAQGPVPTTGAVGPQLSNSTIPLTWSTLQPESFRTAAKTAATVVSNNKQYEDLGNVKLTNNPATNLDRISTRQSQIGAAVSTVDGQLRDVTNKFTEIESELARLKDPNAAIDSAAIDAAKADLTRMQNFAANLQANPPRMSDGSVDQDALQRAQSMVTLAQQKHDNIISQQQNVVKTKVQPRIDELTVAKNELGTQKTALEAQLNTLRGQQKALNDKSDAFADQLSQMAVQGGQVSGRPNIDRVQGRSNQGGAAPRRQPGQLGQALTNGVRGPIAKQK